MATYSKTAAQSFVSLQSVAASSVLLGTPLDVSTKISCAIHIKFGRRAATAAGAGVNIRIEASSKTSGDGHWNLLGQYTTAFAASEPEAVSGTINSGTNVITVASTSNIVIGSLVYIDNGTIANSEWGRVKSIVTNTSITLEDNLVNAQTGATIYTLAEILPLFQFDLSNVVRIRLVSDGASFTQAHAIEAFIVTCDSIS